MFGETQRNSFQKLKEALTNAPVLTIFDPRNETEVHTDASRDGFGAILMQKCSNDQKWHPIYYMSRKTTPAERAYPSYELEALAIIRALNKFRVYLLGISFKIVTDCKAFEQTLKKRDLSPRVARWVLLLEQYNYEVVHRSGERMQHVDALSRLDSPMCRQVGQTLIERIQAAQNKDDGFKAIREVLQKDAFEDYVIENGLLYKGAEGERKLVVPKGMATEIINWAHRFGHFSTKKTMELVQRDYYIKDLRRRVEEAIRNCIPCILGSRKQGKQEGFLHPIPKGDVPLHTFHMDHVGALPSTAKSYQYLLVIVDAFTKFVWLFVTKNRTSAEVIKNLEILRAVFGSPKRIITDKGTAFTSQELTDYCEEEGIQHVAITTGVPRANRQVERVNAIVERVLTKIAQDEPLKWYKHVDRVQRALNSTYQRSINTSPFELLFGTRMRGSEDPRLKELM